VVSAGVRDPRPPPPVTEVDLRREPLLDAYELDTLPGGEPMQATLVNSVYMAYVAGSVARLPWLPAADAGERVRTLSVSAVSQGLLGVACPSVATRNRSFCIRYTAPLGAKHNIFPLDMSVHETAASNDVLSEFAVHLTAALLNLSCGLPHVRVARRERYNCVFTSYAPYPIDYGLLKEDYPSMVEIKESHFRSSVCWDPSIKEMKLLVFSNRPVILVGPRNAWDMQRAMRFFLPRIHASSTRVRAKLPLPAAAAADPEGLDEPDVMLGGESQARRTEDLGNDDDDSVDWDLFGDLANTLADGEEEEEEEEEEAAGVEEGEEEGPMELSAWQGRARRRVGDQT